MGEHRHRSPGAARLRLLAAVVAVVSLVAVACAPDVDPERTSAGDDEILAAAEQWVEDQTSPSASAFVDAVATTDDVRWAPWLLDLLRLGRNSATNARISGILERWSGIPATARIPDLVAYGSWLRDLELDGGPDYREFKVAVYSEIDERFGPLLAEVDDQAELAAIQWGGVPLGGIPQLDDPARLPADEAPWMVADEVILGVAIDGEAVAYPLRILLHHELVNDTVAGRELAIVYCTLCRTGLVFDATVGEVDRTFLTSGLLLDSNKLMVDVETGSLWHHLRGLGVSGPDLGTELVTVRAEHRSWGEWLEMHPDTEVLDLPEPVFFDNPERPPIAYDYTPGAAYQSYYGSEQLWFPVAGFGDQLPGKTLVLGLSNGGEHLALDIAEIGEPGSTATVEVGGATFVVTATGGGAVAVDEAGEPVDTIQGFWFAWHGLHPDTEVWSG